MWTEDESIRITRIEAGMFDVQQRSTRIETALTGFSGEGGLLLQAHDHELRLNKMEEEASEERGRRKLFTGLWVMLSSLFTAIIVVIVDHKLP